MSACATSQTGTKTALAPQAETASVDAYGYAPVRISAFADGSRIALPSQKPDAAKLAAAPVAKAPEPTSGAAAKEARNDIAALRQDVAERKATTATPSVVTVASAELAAKAARSAGLVKPDPKSPLASVVEAVPATIAAVPSTIVAVGETAGAVTVAAVTTTAKAYDAVTERLGDTFKGRDTITGDAAIDRMIERAAAENDIPSELAYAVVRVESHYNPRAKGSGVYGLSQIQPATARSLGFSGQTADLYDPETNLRYGMKYLAGAWQKSGKDICGAAMKYKGGHRTTRMSKSAAAYCANVKRHMAAIERRRGPANRETVVAAAEREKQIAVASIASQTKTLPGVKTEAAPTAAPVIAAAASQAGRSVAASAVPVPAVPGAALGVSLAASKGTDAARGGRVVSRSTPVSAALGLAN